MKREIKYALTIPISEVAHTDKNNVLTCITFVTKTPLTAKQKDRDAENKQLALSLPLSVASSAAITVTRQKAYGHRTFKEGCKLFIYYLKLVI